MKRQLYLFFLVCCPVWLFAQEPVITFSAAGGAGQQLRVLPPVQGEFFMGNLSERRLDSSGTAVFPNTEKVPGAYYFFYKRCYTLYVKPGKSYSLTVNAADTVNPVVVTGPDAEGQLELNNVSAEFYQQRGMRYYAEDSVFAHNAKRVRADQAAQLQRFTNLFREKKTDRAFLQHAEKLTAGYYASVLGATLLRPTMAVQADKKKPGFQQAAVQQLVAAWQSLRGVCNMMDRSNAGSMEFFYFVNMYNTNYLGYLLPSASGTFTKAATSDERDLFLGKVIRQHYREPVKEYLLASWLGDLLTYNQFQAFIPGEYRAFAAMYPGSRFIAPMQKGVQRVVAYHDKIKAGFTDDHRFVEEQPASFRALAAAFPGKTVYIDLWATWCTPCKAQFAYNRDLKALLKKQGVEAVYISIDRLQDEPRWKEMIKYYDLQGYHLRASEALMKDLRDIFGEKNKTLYIPRYAILKNSELVVSSAKQPSDLKGLEEQLNELKTAP